MARSLDGLIRRVYKNRPVKYGEKAKQLHRASEASKWFLGGLSALFFFSFDKFANTFSKVLAIILAAIGIFSYSAAFFIFGREADELDNEIETKPPQKVATFRNTTIPLARLPVKGVIPYDLGILCLFLYACLFFIGNEFFFKPAATVSPPTQIIQISQGSDSLKGTVPPTFNCNDCPGFTFMTNKIFFAFARSEIKPASYPLLDSIAHTMVLNPGRVLLIGAHTDSVGSIKDNLSLSIRRAKAVQQYLITKGIPEGRLKVRGYSKIAPEESNATEAGRQANRRVEFTILKN